MTRTFSRFSFLACLSALSLVACEKRSFSEAPVVTQSSSVDVVSIARRLPFDVDAGHFDQVVALFDDEMKLAMGAPMLRLLWWKITQALGEFRGVTDIRLAEASPYSHVFVNMRFDKGTLEFKVVVSKQGRISGLWQNAMQLFKKEERKTHEPEKQNNTPKYLDFKAFKESSVKVSAGKFELPAMLMKPNTDGPFPVVVLVHGSGPHDHDESIGPNRPFYDLAVGLASKGIASLRYVKRTKQFPTGEDVSKSGYTLNNEVVEDAVAALELVAKHPDVKAEQVFLLGHSLGAMLAPRIAMHAKSKPQGVIAMAAATRKFDVLMLEQTKHILAQDASMPQDIKNEALAKVEKAVEVIRDPNIKPESQLEFFGTKVAGSYIIDLMKLNPVEEMTKYDGRLLLLQGEKDYQVTLKDFEQWQKAVEKRAKTEVVLLSGLNHLFMKTEGAVSVPSDYEKAQHVDERVIESIAKFISNNAVH